jgi:hypothetical protein
MKEECLIGSISEMFLIEFTITLLLMNIEAPVIKESSLVEILLGSLSSELFKSSESLLF